MIILSYLLCICQNLLMEFVYIVVIVWVTTRLGLSKRTLFFVLLLLTSLVPRLSPRANEKSKERGEPGRIYHVRNVIGRENLITCGQTNELAHAVWTEYSCDSFMADKWD